MNAPATIKQTNVERMPKPMEQISVGFHQMEEQLRNALPAHMPVERFVRVCMTAVQMSPILLKADRKSLFLAAMKCAQDGLLPDGRDAAFVPFKDNKAGDWKVQYMPMVGGILKKVRNSNELKSISANIVFEHDKFFYRLGDDEKIEHEPLLDGDRGKPRLVYAVAHTKDGGIYREVMTVQDVNKIRNVSKAKDNGPWVSWWDEMARKTAIRRLSKRLPMSSDLDDLIRRDDDLYEFDAARDAANQATIAKPKAVKGALDVFAGGAIDHGEPARIGNGKKTEPDADDFEDATETYNDETGEVVEAETEQPEPVWPPEQTPANVEQYREYLTLAAATVSDPDKLAAWFKSEPQRRMRNGCGVTGEIFSELQAVVKARATELRQGT